MRTAPEATSGRRTARWRALEDARARPSRRFPGRHRRGSAVGERGAKIENVLVSPLHHHPHELPVRKPGADREDALLHDLGEGGFRPATHRSDFLRLQVQRLPIFEVDLEVVHFGACLKADRARDGAQPFQGLDRLPRQPMRNEPCGHGCPELRATGVGIPARAAASRTLRRATYAARPGLGQRACRDRSGRSNARNDESPATFRRRGFVLLPTMFSPVGEAHRRPTWVARGR